MDWAFVRMGAVGVAAPTDFRNSNFAPMILSKSYFVLLILVQKFIIS